MEKEWSGSTLLASQKVKAGTRYYYIDAKQDTKGNKYIVLSETKMKESEGTLRDDHAGLGGSTPGDA